MSHVLLWQPSECDSMLFSENKYDDDDGKLLRLDQKDIMC